MTRALTSLLTLCCVGALACDDGVDPDPDVVSDELVEDLGEQLDDGPSGLTSERRVVGGEQVAVVELEGGSLVTFIEVRNDEGERGVGVLEESPMNAVSIDDFDALADASVADVFWAVSEPGEAIPEAIARSGELHELGPQGWVLDAIAAGDIIKPRGSCTSNATFTNYVTSKNYDHEYLRLDKHPNTSSYFFEDPWAPGNGQLYDDLYTYSPDGSYNGSVWWNIDRYYTRVGACRISGHPVINGYHYGPRISFDYRDANNNGWYSAFWVDVDPGDSNVTFSWHWYTGANWDWRTQIELAGWDDIFDIGHALNK